jgi:hypothetical protein
MRKKSKGLERVCVLLQYLFETRVRREEPVLELSASDCALFESKNQCTVCGFDVSWQGIGGYGTNENEFKIQVHC